MSRFGDYYKDQITESIKIFYEEKTDDNVNTTKSEIIKDIMEAVTQGIDEILCDES